MFDKKQKVCDKIAREQLKAEQQAEEDEQMIDQEQGNEEYKRKPRLDHH